MNIESAKTARIILSERIERLLDSVQYAETTEDTKRIMAKVGELRRQMPPEPKEPEPVDRAACDAFIEEFCDIESHDIEIQRLILRKTIDKIVVKPDELFLYTNVKKGVCIVINKKGLK